VSWVDDWPVVGELAPAMPAPPWPLRPGVVAPTRDDFDLGDLHPRWISVRERPAEHCTTKDRTGWLRLRARGGSLDDLDVTFVGRRQQHRSCRVRALLDPADGRGGLAVRLDERHHYGIEVADGQARVLARRLHRPRHTRRPLPVDRGRRWLHRPGHRHVRSRRHRPLRLVRLSTVSRAGDLIS
jgi:hypothetical protein